MRWSGFLAGLWYDGYRLAEEDAEIVVGGWRIEMSGLGCTGHCSNDNPYVVHLSYSNLFHLRYSGM